MANKAIKSGSAQYRRRMQLQIMREALSNLAHHFPGLYSKVAWLREQSSKVETSVGDDGIGLIITQERTHGIVTPAGDQACRF